MKIKDHFKQAAIRGWVLGGGAGLIGLGIVLAIYVFNKGMSLGQALLVLLIGLVVCGFFAYGSYLIQKSYDDDMFH